MAEQIKANVKKEDKNMKTTFTLNGTIYESNEKGNYFYKSTGNTDKKGNPVMMRIGRHIFEQAFEEYVQTGANQASADEWDTEKEIEERKEKQAESDKTAEEVINKKTEKKEEKLNAEMKKLGYHRIDSEWNDIRYATDAHEVMAWNTVEEGMKWVNEQTKKPSKPRRSKDIALEVDGVTLTTKQVDFLKKLPNTDGWDGIEQGVWTDMIAESIGWNAMSVGAMISTLREKNLVTVVVQKINGKKCKGMNFTELGIAVAKEMGLD